MNLHEECLLKYLTNPMDLFYTTELLKINNLSIEHDFAKQKTSVLNALQQDKLSA